MTQPTTQPGNGAGRSGRGPDEGRPRGGAVGTPGAAGAAGARSSPSTTSEASPPDGHPEVYVSGECNDPACAAFTDEGHSHAPTRASAGRPRPAEASAGGSDDRSSDEAAASPRRLARPQDPEPFGRRDPIQPKREPPMRPAYTPPKTTGGKGGAGSPSQTRKPGRSDLEDASGA